MLEDFLHWRSVDFDMRVHIVDGIVLWEGNEGKVMRWFLFLGNKNSIKIPSIFTGMNRKERKGLARKLNSNFAGRGNFPGIGKPSSAFLGKDGGGRLFLDFFLEEWQHRRKKGVRLHDLIRRHVDYSLTRPLDEVSKFRSGHIAPLNITESDVGFVLSLDNLRSSEWVGDISILKTLWVNRILVVSSNGHLVGKKTGEELFIG